jgi:hypothetical protein
MTSIGVHEAEIPGNGPPTFKIQGMIHHRIGSLLPSNNQQSKFMQIYFYDNDDATNYRLSRLQTLHHQDLAKQIVDKIQDILRDFNPYVQTFLTIREQYDHQQIESVQLLLETKARPTDQHQRRYNAPTSSEIAVIIQQDQEIALKDQIHVI